MMEAGVLQEVRKALMGHSTGEDVHSTYVHVELPMKRDAIGKLEAWVRSQRKQLPRQGDDHETNPTIADDRRPAAIDTGGLPGASRGDLTSGWARLSNACAQAITWERSGRWRELTRSFVNSRPL